MLIESHANILEKIGQVGILTKSVRFCLEISGNAFQGYLKLVRTPLNNLLRGL